MVPRKSSQISLGIWRIEFHPVRIYDVFRMKAAFKEWAIVVDALETGAQTIILRKGGIAEGKGGFQIDYRSFWLFPTQFHQQGELVEKNAQKKYEGTAKDLPPEGIIRISSFAEVVAAYNIQNSQQIEKLEGLHIWKNKVIRERFDWGKRKDIHALAVRTYKIPNPIEIPLIDSYGGCKSWIELKPDIPIKGANPALDETAFTKVSELFHQALKDSKRIVLE